MQIPKTRKDWDLFEAGLKEFFNSYGFQETHQIQFTSNGITERIEIELEAEAERVRSYGNDI